MHNDCDILIIGAGMTGLTAAAELADNGCRVVVLDKGRGLGGRLATRRMGEASFDHGAQFVTVRTPRFARKMQAWSQAAAAREWCRGFAGVNDGHVRWRGEPGMTGIPKLMAASLDVRLEQQVVALRTEAGWWKVETKTGEIHRSRAVLQTAPVPQALAMLDAGDGVIEAGLRARLETIAYESCLVVMALLDQPSRVPAPGGLQLTEGPIVWLADNQQKGISIQPAVTIHASPEYSLTNWDRDRNETARELLNAAAPWLGGEVKQFQVHGWRYSRPLTVDECGCVPLSLDPPLLLAGDAFAAPRVEGAALSGWAAAAEFARLGFGTPQ
ncbi:MAG: FAD-dependent oxidoreductase [Cephaloticoccus sp.]|nr:FAD-dependent oxidoreductase [Cephaloticoccus sp.]MCF7761618.1 FAD-dependent oxidoreductase [Cephaloticoccus sp.]